MLPLTAWTLSVVFPSTPGLPGLDQIDPKPLLRQLSRQAPFTIRATLWTAVIVFCLTPVLTVGVPLPAFLLPRKLLDKHANKLAKHPNYLIRQTMLMIKTIGGLVWGAAPEVRQRLHMPVYGPDPGTWRQS